MNIPFERILNGADLNNRFYAGSINVVQCIEDTFKQFDVDITPDDFARLIYRLTRGTYYSVISYRGEPKIITAICEYYGYLLNEKYVDDIIDCVTIVSYPYLCTDITKTGYKFTKSQIDKLIKKEYCMLGIVDSMEYKFFIKNICHRSYDALYQEMIKPPFNRDQNNENAINVPEGVKEHITKYIRMYGIVLRETFIVDMLSYRIQYYNNKYNETTLIILRMHQLAKELGFQFSKKVFKMLVEYVLNFMYMEEADIEKLLSYYPDKDIIDRELVLDLFNDYTITLYMKPKYTSYNPRDDIFLLIYKFDNPLDKIIVIGHLLKYEYLKYDSLFLFLMSIDSDIADVYLEKYIKVCGSELNSMIVRNLFVFGSAKTLEILEYYKYIPTYENIKLSIFPDQLCVFRGRTIFIDDKTERYITLIKEPDQDIDEKKDQNTQKNYNLCSRFAFIEVYNSLSARDKEIAVRSPSLSSLRLFTVYNILRYRPTITKEYLHWMLVYSWDTVVTLLHLSRSFNYLLDMIDLETIAIIPSNIGRLWLLTHVIEADAESFAPRNTLLDKPRHVQEDYNTFIKNTAPQFDIANIKKEKNDKIVQSRQHSARVFFKRLENQCNTTEVEYEVTIKNKMMETISVNFNQMRTLLTRAVEFNVD